MNNKISSITLISSIAIAVVFSAVIVWNLNYIFDKFHVKNNIELRKFYVDQQKELIKNEVTRLAKRINSTKQTALENAKQSLKDKIRSADEFIQNVYVNHNHNTQKEHIKSMISSFNWSHNSGYFYVLSPNGDVLYHGGNENLTGANLLEMREKFPRLYDFIIQTKAEGAKFMEYDFPKPGQGDKLFRKLGYAKYNKALNLIIGTGVYIDDLDNVVQKEILDSLVTERFGYSNYGYFWIFDTDYNTVFHIDEDIYKLDMYNFKDINGKYVLRDFVDIAKTRGGGYSSYFWEIPGQEKASEKISYLTLIPEWNWIVGTGFYFENYYELVNAEEQITNHILQQELTRNGLIIFSLFILVVVIALVIYKRISNIEHEQEVYINDLLQYKTVIDKSSIVSITDLNGTIEHVNDQMCEITGYDKSELIGSRHTKLSHPDNPAQTYHELWLTITSGDIWRGIIKNLTKDGGYFYQKSTIVPFKDKFGKIVNYIAVSHDVTEVFENKSQLQKYLNTDQLTDLNNRASLLMEIKENHSSDLAIIDIDDFHKINETYGMKIGDEVLKIFAERLVNSLHLRRYSLYRLHSDVFAVYSGQSDKNLFIINVEKALSEITKEPVIVNSAIELIVGTITGYAHGSDNILSHSDAALQFAKANNISHYVYDPMEIDSSSMYEKNTQVIKMLNQAIDEGRVTPFYQPIRGNGIPKYESLMRILNPDGSILSPADFLDISKQTRFYPQLTRIIAKKSIDMFAEHEDAEFSINISAEDILNTETMNFIYDYAHQKGVADRMILEIVESESLSSQSLATETLYRFKAAGVRIAIDDFGTGYSNFDYLLKIKADYIKIDGSIIKLINKDERAVDIVQSIVSYAQKLNMKTIAEFISDETLAKKAEALGIDYQQGYYHGKPEPELR